MSGLTKFQKKVLAVLADQRSKAHMGLTLAQLAHRCGYRPAASGKLAVYRAAMALREHGFAHFIRDRSDRWGVMKWFNTQSATPPAGEDG